MKKNPSKFRLIVASIILFLSMIVSQIGYGQTYGAGADVYSYSRVPVHLCGNSAGTYSWSPSTGLDSTNVCCPEVNVADTTAYRLTYQLPGDTTHYYDTVMVYIITPAGPNSVSSCTNILNNGDFENGSCTNAWAQNAASWGAPGYGPTNGADYYNTCMSHASPCGVPSWEFWGAQACNGGSAGMMGLQVEGTNVYMEYINQSLPCALNSSQKYLLSVSAAKASGSTSNCGKLGVLLSTGVVNWGTPQWNVPGTPQFTLTTATSAWQTFTFTVSASSANYITLGNFNAPTGCGNNYYFIDDVILKPIAPTLSVSPSATVCAHNTFTLSETGSPAGLCTWKDPSGATIATGVSSCTVSALTSGTYSCIVNLGTCCSALTSTINITVNTSGITVSGSTVTCQNVPVTITASGGTPTYTWTPGSTTGSTYTLSASTVGANTVVVKGGNCGYGTYTVNVNALPTLTVVASPTAICSGSSSTLTASGSSNTYSWSPGGATTASISVTPTVTSTYTVTGTITSTGCTATKTISVNVTATPTVAVSPTVATVCYGSNPAVLTASGASTYTWSPGSTTSCSTCATTTVSPTSNTTYTITGATSGCTGTQTIAVSVTSNSCTGTALGSYTASGTGSFTSTPAFISSNIQIGGGGSLTYTISSKEVRVAPGKIITVKNGATLIIDAGWWHACASCSGSMWQAIYCETGGKVVIQNYSIIEDAVYAVQTATSTATSPTPTITVSDAIFNKNTYGMYLDDQHNADLSGAISVTDAIFTSRAITTHSTTSTNFGNIKTDILAATPTYTSSTNPITTTLAGYRGGYGIYLNNTTKSVFTVTIGAGGSTYTATTNVFDNLDFGIYSHYTSLTVKNSKFLNLTGNEHAHGAAFGIGVYADCPNMDATMPALRIGNNSWITIDNTEKCYFTNCLRGISTYFHTNVVINNNNFDNEATSLSFTGTGLYTGQYGVINSSFGEHGSATVEALQIGNNSCNNYSTGFYHNFDKPWSTATQNCIFANNTISSYTTTPGPGNYVSVGLNLESTDGLLGSGVPAAGMYVYQNTITSATQNAISISNVGSAASLPYLTVSQNTELGLKYVSTATAIASPPLAAVLVSGCNKVKVSDNPKIQCTGLTTYSASCSQYLAGVYVTASTNSAINCNVVTCMGEGFVFEGANTGSSWKENNVQKSRYGLVLRNTGIMGDQGGTSAPIYDIWGKQVSTNITDYQTLCDASDPSAVGFTSKLFCKANTCTTAATTPLPCANTFTNSGFAYGAATLSVTTGSSPCVCVGDCGSGRLTKSDSLANLDSTLAQIVDGIASNTPLPKYGAETRWASQYYVSSTRSGISAAQGYENAKLIASVDAALNAGDYVTVQSLNNFFTPNNIIEQNWQKVNGILFKKLSDSAYKYSSNDITTLEAIAQQCPLTGGKIVYKARGILNGYYQTYLEYPSVCTSNAGAGSKVDGSSTSVANGEILIYPNPTSGAITVEYQVKHSAALQITDISGKLVGTYTLPFDSYKMQVRDEKLENGMYLYRIISDGIVIKTGKIAVLK